MLVDKVKTDTIETWKAKIIEQEHMQEQVEKIRRMLSQNRIATDRYGDVVLWSDIKRVLEEVKSDDK